MVAPSRQPGARLRIEYGADLYVRNADGGLPHSGSPLYRPYAGVGSWSRCDTGWVSVIMLS